LGENPIQILFPKHDEKIAVGVSEDGSKRRIALQANHISQNATLEKTGKGFITEKAIAIVSEAVPVFPRVDAFSYIRHPKFAP